MESLAGNINISGNPTNAILLYSESGTLKAITGQINIRDDGYCGNANSTLLGGNCLSQQFNVYSGQGNAQVIADNLTGALSMTAQDAYVGAATDDLQLGNLAISADPTSTYGGAGANNSTGNAGAGGKAGTIQISSIDNGGGGGVGWPGPTSPAGGGGSFGGGGGGTVSVAVRQTGCQAAVAGWQEEPPAVPRQDLPGKVLPERAVATIQRLEDRALPTWV